MDANRFDALLRALSGAPSRRGTLRLLAGSLVALTDSDPLSTLGKGKKRKHKRKKKHKKESPCPNGKMPCGSLGACCDVAQGSCCGDVCCDSGTVCCGSTCCPSGQYCATIFLESPQCVPECPGDQEPCGRYCCPAGPGWSCKSESETCEYNGCEGRSDGRTQECQAKGGAFTVCCKPCAQCCATEDEAWCCMPNSCGNAICGVEYGNCIGGSASCTCDSSYCYAGQECGP